MAQKILTQEWERLKARTDLEVYLIMSVTYSPDMSLHAFDCEG